MYTSRPCKGNRSRQTWENKTEKIAQKSKEIRASSLAFTTTTLMQMHGKDTSASRYINNSRSFNHFRSTIGNFSGINKPFSPPEFQRQLRLFQPWILNSSSGHLQH